MKKAKIISAVLLLSLTMTAHGQRYSISSPDGHISVAVENDSVITYSAQLDSRQMIAPSPLGFELKDEAPMKGDFEVLGTPKIERKSECWTPVVKNRHAQCAVDYTELALTLREKSGMYRQMSLVFRVFNDGVAFRYTLYGTPETGVRHIQREITGYRVPQESSLWIPNFNYEQEGKSYKSPQEGVFVETPVTEIKTSIHAGLPGLIKVDQDHWMAITEAALNNWPGMYLGRSTVASDGFQLIDTKLAPLWGEEEDGIKARVENRTSSSWRVVMMGHNPGHFIESELIRSLNEPCKIEDTSWIKPGMSAWDHWWSGEVKMEQSVIKQYIDFAATEGWPYMLIDWTWYGPYCTPDAIITEPAPQLDMPEILAYAKQKGVDIWLWLRSEDVNQNDQYAEAFPLFREWGVKGVKIDFMDRDDQDMVNWYHRICKATADNHLMLDLHGAYKPDGLERTYPNLLTREGVLGAENYKFSELMTPEHNVTLAYTRLIAGPMDYTPGGFLNVTSEEFKMQCPTLVSNTRAAELSKFVVYESPFMCFCDHPDNVYGQTGEDFLRQVPVEWEDTRFLGGTPDSYVAVARRSGDKWYVGVLGNSVPRTVQIDLSFLPEGDYSVESWADNRKSSGKPVLCDHGTGKLPRNKTITVELAKAGGYVAIVSAAK